MAPTYVQNGVSCTDHCVLVLLIWQLALSTVQSPGRQRPTYHLHKGKITPYCFDIELMQTGQKA